MMSHARPLAPTTRTSSRPRQAAWLLALGLASPLALAEPRLASIDFLPAVQSVGENGRVLLVNLRSNAGRVNLPPGPCRLAIQFFDANGDEIGAAQPVSLARGQSIAVEAPVFARAGVPSLLRARVNVTPPGTPELPPGPCAGLHGNYEVYDLQSLETKFVSPGTIRGFDPQPDPPGTVGR